MWGVAAGTGALWVIQAPKLKDQKRSEVFQTLMMLITSRSKSYNKLPVNEKNTEDFWFICCGYCLGIPWKLGVKDRILARGMQVEIVFCHGIF
ncbi:hypothetical protein RND71_030538 [Anisodus tanguticus]|uniref:Uncharacterized protein n=1 Tax=Anisodus tanguticus TaxID=243964 RepID=A0AAE1RGM0_9SOLA|nr:hypothetical protein RND71_030538 [Anisodus tanguticus]